MVRKFTDAIEDCTTCLEINPNNLNLLLKRGMNRIGQFQYDKAVKDFTEYLTSNIPEERDLALYSRGICWVQLHSPETAIKDFTSCLSIDPRKWDALSQRGWCWLELGNLKAVIEDCTLCLEINPNAVEALVTRGKAYMKAGQKSKAREDWYHALELLPGDTKIKDLLNSCFIYT
eukprot:TRINITY_DN17887_c0_g1_i3.p1 TRINITY_DN17887_c0_g1~~TRINITY_DN17887_c0_g1_i3.p1  ORF type:complete len:175 (-),score=24.02 TRINITY_DN17887_c0_g1_i3:106-630(-)